MSKKIATEELIQIIMRQTTYTEEEAGEKLAELGYDPISVIRDFMGIKPKEQKQETIKSVNQEIYKQIRYKLDESMRQYTEKQNQKENGKDVQKQ
jgi:DNA-binding ferritin-like protein